MAARKKPAEPSTEIAIPASRVVLRRLSWFKPFEENPREHPETQIQQIMEAMKTWGFTVPLLSDEKGGIIAGHGRHIAAGRLGMTKVPVIIAAGWTEAQKLAYVIADNKLTENSNWNKELLTKHLQFLSVTEFNVGMMGFSEKEAMALLKPRMGLTDPETAPAVEEDVVAHRGDLWLLGEHRVFCGDATNPEHVAALLDGRVPILMATDPPYGVNYDPEWRGKAGVGSKDAAKGKVQNDDRCDWREAWALFPGDVAYVWHGGLHEAAVIESLVAVHFNVRAQIIWTKTRPVIGRGNYHWQHEPALYVVREGKDDNWQEPEPDGERFAEEHETAAYAVRDGMTANWQGSRKQSTVWPIEHVKSETGHGTQKPVQCMARPMENNSEAGDEVYDPFLGSGTSIIAAEMTGRICLGLELSPAYVDVIIRRWQNFTGEKARLASTGKTFTETEKERSK